MSEGVKKWDIKKASLMGWPFFVPSRRFMVAHDIRDKVGFGSAVNYRATMLQLFGTSPSLFHSFNMAELTYSVPPLVSAVLRNH